MTVGGLRDYQREAVDKTRAAHERGIRRPAGVLPTGTGKTHVFAGLINEAWGSGLYGERTLVVAHRDELIRQAYNKVREAAPHLRVGIVKATVNEARADVVIASVPTLRNASRRSQIRGVGLVVVDECHHATAPSYRAILEHYGCFAPPGEPGAYALGVTATMMRGDDAALGDIWEEVVFSRGVTEMIARGYLVMPHGKRVLVEKLDLDRVKMKGGDFADGDLGRALEASLAPQAVVRAYREECPDLPGILFAPTVATAQLFGDAFAEAGFAVGVVHGKTPTAERRQMLADYQAGRLQILSNCGVLTEGTDLPRAQVCVVARPTKSAGLYVQMIGRVLRPAVGKDFALVLDVTGVSQRHSLVSTVQLDGERPDRRMGDSPQADDVASELLGILDMPADPVAERSGAVAAPPEWIDGQLRTLEVDLFAGSGLRWGCTYAGVWYLLTPMRYLVVVPGEAAGSWDVAWVDKETRGASGWLIRGQRDQGVAMGFAESCLSDDERRALRRPRARARVDMATDAQKWMIRRWGGNPPEGMTKLQASNMIDQAIASKRIDTPLPDYARR